MRAWPRAKFVWWKIHAKLFGWRDRVDVDALIAEAEEKKIAQTVRPRRRTAIRPGCPTPRKRAYPSLTAARSSRGAGKNKGSRMRAYRCPCGQYHLARREA